MRGVGCSIMIVLHGTSSQIEWAELIKCRVAAEFDRVEASFRLVADKQSGLKRADTEVVIAILEDKRKEVLSNESAGYFIRDWQDLSDQVRQLISEDSRYQAIKSNRAAAS